jgi:HD-GYP domain-containing protein (c-di-GMP phosphodiesterase class II)
MYTINHLNLLQLILALSEALDLASPLLAKHQLRTAYISWKISEKLNYNHEEVEKIVFAALMHDIGALAPEDKINLHEDEYDKDVEIHCILGEKLLKHVKELMK